jgi:hypothetical protein
MRATWPHDTGSYSYAESDYANPHAVTSVGGTTYNYAETGYVSAQAATKSSLSARRMRSIAGERVDVERRMRSGSLPRFGEEIETGCRWAEAIAERWP